MAEPKSLNDALMLVCAYRECAVDVIEPALADPRLRQELVARTRAQAATERELASAAKVRSEQKTFFGPDMRAVDAHTAVWRAENAGLLNVAANIIESDTPEPDWADLGVMARNSGWAPERWMPGQVHWGRRNPNGFIEHQHGWARVRRLRLLGHVVIDLFGPAEHEDLASSARLVDPTPARVLNIARELGIGGTS